MAPRGGYDRSAYTGVGEAPPHSHFANPLAVAAAGAVAGGDGSSSRCSSLSSAAAATALRRHSLTQDSLRSLQDPQRPFSPLPNAGSGMRRSNSTASTRSQTTTIKRTNPDRSMSLTRRTVSQYGSFEIVKEDTQYIPAPARRPLAPPQAPRLMLSPSSRGPPSILSDSDLATVSEEEPPTKPGETTRHNPPPRTLSPIKPALKDASSSVASSDNESISGAGAAKPKKPHARVSFFENDPDPDPFRHFGSSPSLNYNNTSINRKTTTAPSSSSQPFNSMNAKTHAAQAAFRPKAPAAASGPRSPNLAAAAAARSHKNVKHHRANGTELADNDNDDDDDDSGESIYSDCDDGLEANNNSNNNNSNSIMEALHQAPPSKKKGQQQQQQPATLRGANNKKKSQQPHEARANGRGPAPYTPVALRGYDDESKDKNNSSNENKNSVARKPVTGVEDKKIVGVPGAAALDITPRPSDADDDDSDDSDTWRRQRMARRRGGANGRMKMSLREARPVNANANANNAIPTPPPSDTSATAQPHIPASVMATAAQNVALTTQAMNGGAPIAPGLGRTPSESSFKKERAGAANGADTGLQNGFRLSLRNEAAAAADNSHNQKANNNGGGRFKSRFEDSDDDDDDFAAPPLAAKTDYLSAPAFRENQKEKDKDNESHQFGKKLSVFSPKKEAKVLIPRKKPSKSQLNGGGGGMSGGADLAPISSASAADSPTEPTGPKATKSVPTMRAPKQATAADNYYPATPVHHKRFKGLRRLFKLD
ncbi:hypothetical protein TRICI_006207 [Trichomonascus ciferrii]|uniref:Uncharacterized protein n=1 Tax=Trichomonascus ciferrii TaxID=44093 RepID=A0A642UK29_9ASCO|nr:hypothetical protein TRICI_006207 [Trichomonascus ciferrii]